MKKIILILILVAGVGTGLSFQVGRVIETELPAVLNRIGDLGQMQITVTGYDRTIFRSTVTTTTTLASLSGSHEQIILRHEIWHGPFPFGKSSTGAWHFKPMSALAITRIDRENPPTGLIGTLFTACPDLYETSAITGFDFAGNGAAHFTVPGFEKSFGSGDETISIDWQGINGTAFIDKSLKHIKGEISLPMVRLSNQTSRLETGGIKSTYRIFEEAGLLLGNVTLDAGLIEIFTGREKSSLLDFQFRNAASLENDLVSYSVAVGIETLQTGGQAYGPAGFELDFINLDAATIVHVQKQLQTIQTKINKLSEQEIGNRIVAIYADALPALLSKNPEIRLNFLNLRSPNGEFWSKGNILFEENGGRAITNLDSFLGIITARGESQISKPLLQALLERSSRGKLAEARDAGKLGEISNDQFNAKVGAAAGEELARLERDGIIAASGDNYTAEFRYQNRQATLNNRPLASR